MNPTFKDIRVALVTGASRGLGFEASKQLAEKQIHVVLSSRDPKKGEKALQEIKRSHTNVSYFPLDIDSETSVDQIAKFIQSEFGRLDILINNAGVFLDDSSRVPGEKATSLFNTPISLIEQSLNTNTFGAIRMIQKMVPLMKLNQYGRIVNVSSGMGQLSEMNGRWPGYRISKTALNAVTRIASDELQGSGILVNSVCPGWVRTDMGGPEAELTPEEGVDTIVWLATLPQDGPSGAFFRERKPINW